MNKQSQIVSLRTPEIIENEAADWLAKLDGGNVSARDRRALKHWLSRDPQHARALKSLASMWSDMGLLLNDLPAGRRAATETPSLFSLVMRTRQLPFVMAAILLCAIGLFIWEAGHSGGVERAFYVTGIGVQQVEKFSDGSIAHLNTDSMIETEYSPSARIVRLLRGEAMFDVTHDPDRPFIVYAGDRRIRAVGTTFNVRLVSENIVVTVTDGRVQLSKRVKGTENMPFTPEQEVILLSAGEQVEIDEKVAVPELKKIQHEELERRFSWLDGQLVFKNERLEQVIEEISRYVRHRIIIEDPELRDARISGRFQIGDTEALLEAIEVSFNVQAAHVDDQTILLPRQVKK